MKTPEEILEKYTEWQGEKAVRTEENMLDAMEEYGKQQWNEAINAATINAEGYYYDEEGQEIPAHVSQQSIQSLLK